MEMTLRRLGLSDLKGLLSSATMPLGILMLVAMMVLPLPVFLLDTFFVSNILISLVILMVSLQTYRPLDFSSFPSLLLIATVLRLALNVASTRIVLSEGHTGPDAAGQVIKAFGEFVIAGNYAVGIFVFVILVIINLLVITKGAGRVSEVTARFTLDAMPGKQMAIDADLNAGVLSNEEATLRRKEISSEADFYGAMDGASKFVKGDAVAGILILIINIVGGLIIGLAQHSLSFEVAAQNYVLLSVGDGLVAQIPSLLLAISTAIIVTRVSSTQDMAQHIGEQVSLSRAWYPVAGVLLLLGFVPGMPNALFLIAGLAAGGVAFFVNKKMQAASEQEAVAGEAGELRLEGDTAKPEQIELSEIADNSPVSIQLGYGLVEMVNDENGGTLVNRVTGIRRQVSKSLGFVVPAVRIRDDLTLEANTYRLRIGQTIVGEDQVYPERKLAIPGENSSIKIEGIEVKDPTFGMDAVWIMPNDVVEAESKGYVIIAPDSVMTTHLSQILYKYAGQLVGQDDIQMLLDNLSETAPNLVQSVVPKLVPLHQLTGILRALLEERVPISDLRRILENLATLAGRNLSIIDTAEMLRPELAGLLIQQVAPLNQPLPVITLGSELEHMLITMARQSGEEGLVIDNALAQQLLRKISDTNDALAAKGRQAVIVVSPAIRKEFSKIIRQHIDDIVVLAFTELPETRKIEVVATITGEADS
ncbi:MAG: flagellar biosynthesis protein FlhA [Alphaproteobacteria bacterium]|jgi:flagellar biosynthesis protein FlhA|nr:flagellar biosynthesis protein FlhA [Alphaproteobacteria bacterium]